MYLEGDELNPSISVKDPRRMFTTEDFNYMCDSCYEGQDDSTNPYRLSVYREVPYVENTCDFCDEMEYDEEYDMVFGTVEDDYDA